MTAIKAPSVDSSHAISLFKVNPEGTSCHICQRNKSYELPQEKFQNYYYSTRESLRVLVKNSNTSKEHELKMMFS